MKTKNSTLKTSLTPVATAVVHEFKGFDDWIELFRAGHQVDSTGNGRDWTASDIDEIIRNHSDATAAPIVIGHPKTDAPAYGWSAELKRDGDILLGRFEKVEPTFADMVQAGRFRRRSVAIGHLKDKGLYLRHVGWLGAAAPAVHGLADHHFNADAEEALYEFSYEEAHRLNVVSRLFRGIREFFVERYGVEAADKALPDFAVQDLTTSATRAAVQAEEQESTTPLGATYSADLSTHSTGQEETTVAEFTQQQLDDAVAKAREEERTTANTETNEFRARVQKLEEEKSLQDAKQHVDALVTAGKVLPAQSAGMTEFVASLSPDASFEFSSGDESTSTNPRDFFLNTFMANQPKVAPIGKQTTASDPIGEDDFEAIRKRASEFQESERQAGRVITFTDAWNHAKQEAAQ